ncbi:MAG: hypothetical protein HYS33_03450 [Acidobacteria bacterium]|nr:hypothetical protein [Acidobacteriota bacterium]
MGSRNASPGLEWFWQRLRDVRHPHFLDCGSAIQATVQVLLRRGAKLYVADLISPARDGAPTFWDRSKKPAVFLSKLFLEQLPDIPPASLSGVFCWHLLDLLPRQALPEVVDRLFGYVAPGGALFCLLREPYLASGAESMWWLESPTALASDDQADKPFPYPALTNREMERLVPSGVLKTFLTRSGRREVLATK